MKRSLNRLSPVICTAQEKSALNFIFNRIEMGEPCSVFGMEGLGKGIIYQAFLQEFKERKHPYLLRALHATDSQELQAFLNNLQVAKPTLVAVNFSLKEDISWFLKKLEALRKKYSTAFVCVIFASLGNVREGWKERNKILLRSPFYLKPLNFEDTKSLLQSFEKRFNFHLEKGQVESLYKLSGGHIGLLKSLSLLIKENSKINLGTPLLGEESLQYRLEEIGVDLGKSVTDDLGSEREKNKLLFEKFGILVEGKIFSPLWEEFLKSTFPGNQINLLELTLQERDLFEFLKNHQNALVTREQVAKAIWGDEWEEKYSDWALDALIYRLRIKIKSTMPNTEIETRKKQGFIFNNHPI